MQNLLQFQIKEVYQDNKTVYRALLSHEDDLLRVETRSNISEEQANQYIQIQVTRMNALFEKARSPYPGDVSDEISCPDSLKPSFGKERGPAGIEIQYFVGFVNDRLAYGVCTDDAAVYRSIMAILFCPKQKNVYQLEIIIPREKYERQSDDYVNMLKSISCT